MRGEYTMKIREQEEKRTALPWTAVEADAEACALREDMAEV